MRSILPTLLLLSASFVVLGCDRTQQSEPQNQVVIDRTVADKFASDETQLSESQHQRATAYCETRFGLGENVPYLTLSMFGTPYPEDPRSAKYQPATVDAASAEILDVHDYELADDTKEQIRRNTGLRWLCLSTKTTAADLQWIGDLMALRGLSMRGCDFRGADFGALRDLHALQWLCLADADMSEKEFLTLPRFGILHGLEVSTRNVTDAWVTHLASLKLDSLRSLLLYNTSVTDRGMSRLCSAYDLEHLDIYGCSGITAKSVDRICSMKRLRFLGIGLSGVSAYEEDFARRLPKCSIDAGG